MNRSVWIGTALFALLVSHSWANETGLITALSGTVKLKDEKAAVTSLKAFTKLRPGDQIMLEEASRIQVVYFDGGLQETWLGSGEIGIGNTSSKKIKGSPQLETRTLPAILVKQLTKTPSAEGNVKTGMVRTRGVGVISSKEKTEAAEKEYAQLRSQTEAGDRNPDLYLLASYLELREYDKLESFLKELNEKSPTDSELASLTDLYTRAINELKSGK